MNQEIGKRFKVKLKLIPVPNLPENRKEQINGRFRLK